MEKKQNVRYGVVNVAERTKFEKKFQKPFRFDFITKNKLSAIKACRKKNNSDYIVEEIYDTEKIRGNRMEIYRSGEYKE